MLKTIVAIALGAGLALSPLAALAQTDQSTAPAAGASATPAPAGLTQEPDAAQEKDEPSQGQGFGQTYEQAGRSGSRTRGAPAAQPQ